MNGASGTQPLDKLDIPVFGRRVLDPSGEFLLLAGAKCAYRAGDWIVLTLQPADGKQQAATLPPRRDPEERGAPRHFAAAGPWRFLISVTGRQARLC